MQLRWCTLFVAQAACAGRWEPPPKVVNHGGPVATAGCREWTDAGAATATSDSGTITGVVRDAKTCEVGRGVTVVLRSPALPDERAVVADDHGRFVVDHLPAGIYRADMRYHDASGSRGDIVVRANSVARLRLELDRASRGKPKPE